MKRISPHTVELAPIEMRANDLFELRLEEGEGILAAVDAVSDRFGARLPVEFYAWLLFPSTAWRYFVVDGELFYDCDQANCPCTS